MVAPSLPGYGFSDKPTDAGWDVPRIADAWIALMQRLGYDALGRPGRRLGRGGHHRPSASRSRRTAPRSMSTCRWCFPTPDDLARPDAGGAGRRWPPCSTTRTRTPAIPSSSRTRPQTLGYGLVDSPAGQAAWIYEKMWAWTDNKGDPEDALTLDEMLDNIMLYWLPAHRRLVGAGCTGRASRSFALDQARAAGRRQHLSARRSSAPRGAGPSEQMSNIIHWNELDRGGHFAAWEQPELLRRARSATASAKVR